MRALPSSSIITFDGFKSRWQLAIGFRKQRSHRHFVGTEEQKQRAEQGTEVVNNIYLYDVALTYDVNHRFNLTAAIPFMKATRRRGTSPQIFHSFGFGDLVVMGRMWLFKQPSESPRNISFGVGIKFPTGKSNVTDTVLAGNGRTVTQVVDQSIQLGDGGNVSGSKPSPLALDCLVHHRSGISRTSYPEGMTYLVKEDSEDVGLLCGEIGVAVEDDLARPGAGGE